MRSFNFAFVLVCIVVVCCTKEDPSPRAYPRVLTSKVAQISEGGAVFSGEITYTSVLITDHGFVWSNATNFDPREGDELSLGSRSDKGQFSAPCTYALKKGKTYYVRAYAKSAGFAVYGDVMTFVSQGSEAPVLKDFYPKQGSWDDHITLLGNNLTAIEKNMKIKFGEYDAFIVHSSADTAIVEVPYSLRQKESSIALSLGQSTSAYTAKFVLKSPEITAISPAAATRGTEVAITGLYLNGPIIEVSFGGAMGVLKTLSKSKITCIIPDNAPAGSLKVSVRTGDGELVDEIDFEVL